MRHGTSRVPVLTLIVLVTACPTEPKPGSSPAPKPAPASPSGDACRAEGWLTDVVELGQRAARGDSVVTPEGCSLFDGALLGRGFPATSEEARVLLTVEEGCVPVLAVSGSRLWLERRDGKAMVARARMVDAAASEPPDVKDWETGIVRAARCPAPERRLKTERDAGAALSYALAMAELRQALEAVGAKQGGPSVETRAVLDNLCKATGPLAPVSDEKKAREAAAGALPVSAGKGPDIDPFAANALVMAGSFTIFGTAAGQLKVEDPGIKAVRPAALGVIAAPPRTNLEGVCALHFMAGVVSAPADVATQPAAKKGKARRK